MNIAIIVEGKTEQAFKRILVEFLKARLPGRMPKIKCILQDGRIPTGEKFRRLVENLLSGRDPYNFDHVMALTDVYTGTREFADAADAKAKMREWVGPDERFHPHCAQHDFEAWLLPFWPTIQKLAGHNRGAPSGPPEAVNHDKPPSRHVKEIFEIGTARDSYVKPRDAARILKDNNLADSADACPELKDFLNTIITLAGGPPL